MVKFNKSRFQHIHRCGLGQSASLDHSLSDERKMAKANDLFFYLWRAERGD
jgi:hypothetical protein